MVIVKHHNNEEFMVRSDGADFRWHDAYNLCHEVLGYSRREFHIVELPGGVTNMFFNVEAVTDLEGAKSDLELKLYHLSALATFAAVIPVCGYPTTTQKRRKVCVKVGNTAGSASNIRGSGARKLLDAQG